MSYLGSSDHLGDGYGVALFYSVALTSFVVTVGAMLFAFLTDPVGFTPAVLLIAPLYFLFTAAISGAAAMLLGLPLTLLLASKGLERTWSYPLAGLIGGVAVVSLLFGTGVDFPELAVLGGLAGGVCGLTWWRFHRCHFQNQGVELG